MRKYEYVKKITGVVIPVLLAIFLLMGVFMVTVSALQVVRGDGNADAYFFMVLGVIAVVVSFLMLFIGIRSEARDYDSIESPTWTILQHLKDNRDKFIRNTEGGETLAFSSDKITFNWTVDRHYSLLVHKRPNFLSYTNNTELRIIWWYCNDQLERLREEDENVANLDEQFSKDSERKRMIKLFEEGL